MPAAAPLTVAPVGIGRPPARIGASGPMLLVTFVVALAGCGPSKASGSSPPPSSTSVSTGAPTVTATAPLPSGAPSASAAPSADPIEDEREQITLPGEPDRRTLKSVADEPAVDQNRDFIADHYGVVQLPFPLQLQSMPLPRGRRALLLTGQGPALDKPLVLVVGQSNTLLWSKPRPLAGTHEQAREITISRGPNGQVFLFLYDEPSKVLAARAWTSEGGIFADFQVLTAEGCDAVTVRYWPGRGWVAALLSAGTIHAQILGENGSLRWPGNGIEVTPPAGPAPAASRAQRPKIEITGLDAIEITVGARKVRVSPEGKLIK